MMTPLQTQLGNVVRALVLVLVGCGGDGDDEDDAGFDCDITAVYMGTYRITLVETSGDCGPAGPPQVVTVPSPGDPNCIVESASVSADQCTISVQGVCELEDEYGPYSIRQSEALTQQDEHGDLLLGTGETTVFDADGVICHNTFSIRSERI